MLQCNDKILPENKHVIIMTNNEFYSTPVQTFNHFYNQTSDQLADHIYQNQFKLSVICPRKITGTNQIFFNQNLFLIHLTSKFIFL